MRYSYNINSIFYSLGIEKRIKVILKEYISPKHFLQLEVTTDQDSSINTNISILKLFVIYNLLQIILSSKPYLTKGHQRKFWLQLDTIKGIWGWEWKGIWGY